MSRHRRPAVSSSSRTPRRRRWVSAAVLAATGPLAGSALTDTARGDSQPAPPTSATVTTAEDSAAPDDGALSLREALGLVIPGGDGVRFNLPTGADGVPPVFRLLGDLPAGRAGVNVHLDDADAGPVRLLVQFGATAAGPQRLDVNLLGGGSLAVDLGSAAAAELALAGRNAHALTRVDSGTVVGASATAFGRELLLGAGGAARMEAHAYLGRLSGDGTLNLGDALLTLGLFPKDPADAAAGADGPGYGSAFAGTLAGSDRGGLHKAGTGTVTLTGANTYGGGTAVTGGVLEVDSARALGTGSLLLDNNATLRTLGVLDDRPESAGESGGSVVPAFVRNVTIQAGGGTVDLAGTEQLFGGTIGGAGGLSVVGGGTLTLAGHNTHRGGTSVFGPDTTLVLASATALGAADVGVNGGTLRTAHTGGAVTFTGGFVAGVDGATIETGGGDWIVQRGAQGGDLTKTGEGELRLQSAGTISSLTVTGGSVAVTGLSALGSGRVTLDGGALFADLADGQTDRTLRNRVTLGAGGGTIRNGRDVTLAGKLNGRGGLVKRGGGTLTLAGENVSAGGVTVKAGAVRFDDAAALGRGPLTLDGGAVLSTGELQLGGRVSTTWTEVDRNGDPVDGSDPFVPGPGDGAFVVADGGGTIRHADGATTVIGGAAFLGGDLNLTGNGRTVFAANSLGVGGGTTRVSGAGTLELHTAVNSVELGTSAALVGTGRVLGDVVAAGVVNPGGGVHRLEEREAAYEEARVGFELNQFDTDEGRLAFLNPYGPKAIEVDGDFTLRNGGELVIDAGAGGADLVVVGGAADLSKGTVRVNVAGSTPEDRAAFAGALAKDGARADLTVLRADGGVTGPGSVEVGGWAFEGAVLDRQHTGASAEPLVVRLSAVADAAAVFGDAETGAAADAVLALLPTASGPAAEFFAEIAFADRDDARRSLRGLTGRPSAGLDGVSFAGAGAVRRTAFRALRAGGPGGTFRGQSPEAVFRGQSADGTGDDFGFGSFEFDDDGGVTTADRTDEKGGGVEKAAFTPGRAGAGRGDQNPLPWGGFAEGYVVGGHLGSDGTDNDTDTDYTAAGTVFGIDRLVAPGTRLGVLAGVGGANSEAFNNTLDSDVSTWQVGLYGSRVAGRWHATGAAVYGGESYDLTRTVRAGSRTGRANGETTGSTVTLAAETGYLLPVELLDLRPLLGVQYVHAARDGYRETGMGDADLIYGDASADSLRLQVGARASKLFGEADGFGLIPELRGWWFGEVLGDDAPAPVRFAAAPTLPAFGTVGSEQVSQVVLGTGLTFLGGPHVRLYANGDLLFGAGDRAIAGTFGGELRW